MASDKKQRTQDPEQVRRKKEEQARRSRRRNRQLLGLVLSILIIWGAVSIVQSGFGLVQNALDNSEEKEEYRQRLQTMVQFDVLPFDDVTQLDADTLKQVAIWGVYYNMAEQLERNELGAALIPTIEVDRYLQSLFGPSYSFGSHQTFETPSQALYYEYDEEALAYIMPITGFEPDYLPVVVDIQRMSGGYRRVVVGYCATRGTGGIAFNTVDYENPNKYLDFIFRRDGNEYYLERLERNTTHEVTARTEESQPAVSLPPQVVLNEEEDSSLVEESDIILEDSSTAGMEVGPEDIPDDSIPEPESGTGDDDSSDTA